VGGWGRIVNVGAGSAYLRNHSVYGLAKNAVAMLTEQLALELGPRVMRPFSDKCGVQVFAGSGGRVVNR
jgi:NAD(P)-dependent dehydrogenase (short-subunit alcohol dehydrogenase family)